MGREAGTHFPVAGLVPRWLHRQLSLPQVGAKCHSENSRKALPPTRTATLTPVGGNWHKEPACLGHGGMAPPAGRACSRDGTTLTLHGLDLVGDVEAAQRGERSQECGHVGGTLEALRGGLHTLPVVNLQVDDGAGWTTRERLGPEASSSPAHWPGMLPQDTEAHDATVRTW